MCNPSGGFKVILLLICSIGLFCMPNPLPAQTNDTTRIRENAEPIAAKKSSTAHTLLPYAIPAVITGYGVGAIGPSTLIYDRFQAKKDIQQAFPGFHSPIDNYLQFVPAAATFSLNLCGVKAKNNIYDEFFLYAGSMFVSVGITTGLKYATKMLRPDGSTYNSFPSGHTTSAFTGAELMNQEYKSQSILYPVFGYTVASATGMMRMMNNRHWLSDVLVGAGIGMISTKLVYAVYPWVKDKFVHPKHHQEVGTLLN